MIGSRGLKSVPHLSQGLLGSAVLRLEYSSTLRHFTEQACACGCLFDGLNLSRSLCRPEALLLWRLSVFFFFSRPSVVPVRLNFPNEADKSLAPVFAVTA